MSLEQELISRIPEVYQPRWDDLDGSVDASARGVATLISEYQLQAAAMGSQLVAEVEAMLRVEASLRTSPIVPEAFAGVTQGTTYALAEGGLPLETIAHRSADIMKRSVLAGMGSAAVLEAGYSYMRAIAGSTVTDTARNASFTRQNTSTILKDYVRAVQPGACSRCIVLAGKESSDKPFLRHPLCRCYAMPVAEITDGTIAEDPMDWFKSLSPAEQDKRFTKAGAEAIREGADIGRVVNARRGADGIMYNSHGAGSGRPRGARMQKRIIGMHKDGTPIEVYATNELISRRGRKLYNYSAGRRLMPESILSMANGDRALFRRMLADYGYMR